MKEIGEYKMKSNKISYICSACGNNIAIIEDGQPFCLECGHIMCESAQECFKHCRKINKKECEPF